MQDRDLRIQADPGRGVQYGLLLRVPGNGINVVGTDAAQSLRLNSVRLLSSRRISPWWRSRADAGALSGRGQGRRKYYSAGGGGGHVGDATRGDGLVRAIALNQQRRSRRSGRCHARRSCPRAGCRLSSLWCRWGDQASDEGDESTHAITAVEMRVGDGVGQCRWGDESAAEAQGAGPSVA